MTGVDEVLAFFGDPETRGVKEDAVACVMMAIEMQQQMHVLREHWKQQGVSTPLEIRIGVGTGDCTEEDGDYFGEPPIMAARLCAAATPSQILAP